MTIQSTHKVLLLVENVEAEQVPFTLCSRDQWSKWMQDVFKTYMDSYMATNGSCFIVTWTIFKNRLLGYGPNTKPRDRDTPKSHNRWFMIFYHVWGPTWIEFNWNRISLRDRFHMTSHYTWGPVTILHMILEVSWDGIWTLLLGSHNLMVTALWLVYEVALKSSVHMLLRKPIEVTLTHENSANIVISYVLGEVLDTIYLSETVQNRE